MNADGIRFHDTLISVSLMYNSVSRSANTPFNCCALHAISPSIIWDPLDPVHDNCGDTRIKDLLSSPSNLNSSPYSVKGHTSTYGPLNSLIISGIVLSQAPIGIDDGQVALMVHRILTTDFRYWWEQWYYRLYCDLTVLWIWKKKVRWLSAQKLLHRHSIFIYLMALYLLHCGHFDIAESRHYKHRATIDQKESMNHHLHLSMFFFLLSKPGSGNSRDYPY